MSDSEDLALQRMAEPPNREPFEGLVPGVVVQYRRRDNPDDPENPVTYGPKGAIVMEVHPDGRTVDLLVFGAGGDRTEWAKGKLLYRFRGGVPYSGDQPSEARWWEPLPTIAIPRR